MKYIWKFLFSFLKPFTKATDVQKFGSN